MRRDFGDRGAFNLVEAGRRAGGLGAAVSLMAEKSQSSVWNASVVRLAHSKLLLDVSVLLGTQSSPVVPRPIHARRRSCRVTQ